MLKLLFFLLIVLTIFLRAVNVPNVILEYFYRKYGGVAVPHAVGSHSCTYDDDPAASL